MTQRAAEAGMPAGTAIDHYVTKAGLGLSLDVPSIWDLGESSILSWLSDEDDIIGSALTATPDWAGFGGETAEDFAVPGVFVGASHQLAADFQPNRLLDDRTGYYAAFCRLTDHVDVAAGGYSGRFELFADCASRPMLALNVELLADDNSHVVSIHLRIVNQSELLAARRIFSTIAVLPNRLLR